jgi:hypothetical protein
MAYDPDSGGYWLVASDGGVFAYGGAPFQGSMGGHHLVRPVVSGAATFEGGGYWEVASDGGLFAFNAEFQGSEGGQKLSAPVVGMAVALPVETRPTVGLAPSGTGAGSGYWLFAGDGTVSPFGRAPNLGAFSEGDSNAVAIESTPDGGGYYTVDDAGCMGTRGDAIFEGDLCNKPLSDPIVGLAVDAAAPGGSSGYWLADASGGVYSFGAPYHGSVGGRSIPAPVSAIAPLPSGLGYYELGLDGTVYPFGTATSHGNWVGSGDDLVVSMAVTHDGGGYWLVDDVGDVEPFGDAVDYGSPAVTTDDVTAITATPDGLGYWLVSSDGNVYPEGDAVDYGSTFGVS